MTHTSGSRALSRVTALLYAWPAIGLLLSVLNWGDGKNPRWLLLSVAVLALAMSGYAWLRDRRLTLVEAEAMIVLGMGCILLLSYNSGNHVGALSNGMGLPLMGIYAGWFFRRRGISWFYVGLAAWAAVMWNRGDDLVTTTAVGVALETVTATEVFRLLVHRLVISARTDSLTQVRNRLGVQESATQLMELTQRRRQPLSVVLIDVDNLREVNNTIGHSAGDDLLRRAAQEWSGSFRADDVVGRIGGDEFVILLPNTTLEQAESRLREVQARSEFDWTFGVAELEPGETYEDAVRRADRVMYGRKHSQS
jgi:diguanylate cyclase (GGDEF)-like protein